MASSVRFVQFPHPGSEHVPDHDRVKEWNPTSRGHARKFLELSGSYLDHGGSRNLNSGAIWAWAEWEPESEVITDLRSTSVGEPERLFRPYWVAKETYAGLHNTDPFIFGGFYYANCKQSAQPGLKELAPGSVIVFGSRVQGAWVVDTVFVVRDSEDHDAGSSSAIAAGRVPDGYEEVVFVPTYATDPDPSYRLYFGATVDEPFEGMFSFFPCIPAGGATGFARPRVELSGFINPGSFRVPRGAGRSAAVISVERARSLWASVRAQIESAGLALGVFAEMPSQRTR